MHTSSLFVMAVCAHASVGLASTIYVDADAGGGNDGSSWEDAYTDLSDALWSARPGDQVWVAEGVYVPTRASDPADPWAASQDPRDAFFWIKRRVEVLGGFDGTETTLAERAGLFATTVLEGDLGVAGDRSDNAYRVVRYTTQHADTPGGPDSGDQFTRAAIDGFTIRNAEDGPGMAVNETQAVQGVNLSLYNLTFADNNNPFSGGGLSWNGVPYSSAEMRGCSFVNNTSGARGGGASISANGGFLQMQGCSFSENACATTGGGLSLRVTMRANNSPKETLQNCVFESNHAGEDGGGLYVFGFGGVDRINIFNSVFASNTADGDGGAIWVYGGATLPQDIGVATIEGTKIMVNLSTFYGNTAGGEGGAIYLGTSEATSGVASVTNAIFWNNSAPVDPVATPTASIDFAIVGTPWTGAGGGEVSVEDPRFVDPDNGDFRLASSSPAIDRGATLFGLGYDFFDLDADADTLEALPVDLAGVARRFDAWTADTASPFSSGPAPDFGAIESLAACAADMNSDGVFDMGDIMRIMSWHTAADPRGDLNRDGRLDLADIVIFASGVGDCE